MTASKKIRTSVYLDQEVKDQARELFGKYHISLSDAVNMFLSQSVINQGLPFDMKIPRDVELIKPSDLDYKLVEKTRSEETISLDEFIKI
jgi:addiction module RelB/DinJ family antitoxin